MKAYKTLCNINLLVDTYPGSDREALPGVGHISHPGDEADPADLADDGICNDDYRPGVIQAEAGEVDAWKKSFLQFSAQMAKSDGLVREALKAFQKTVEVAQQQRKQAWRLYEPVHLEIERRQDLVQEARDQAAQDAEKAAQEAAEAALADQDAELGPRLFYVTRPSQRGQDIRELDLPTVHHVDCHIARRLKKLPEPVRLAEAFEALMDGGRPGRKSWRWEPDEKTTSRIPGVACEHCSAFDLLKAHAPETFMDWLERTESAPGPEMPPDTYSGTNRLGKMLGMGLLLSMREKSPGWIRVSDEGYRERGAIEPGEIMLGWAVPGEGGKAHLAADVDRLKKLFEVLPPKGFHVRWIEEPFTDDLVVCEQALAVRHMTKWEKRQFKEQA